MRAQLTIYVQLTYTVEFLHESVHHEHDVHAYEWYANQFVQSESRQCKHHQSNGEDAEQDEAELGMWDDAHFARLQISLQQTLTLLEYYWNDT